jgi:hypothetical protein
VVLNSKDRNYGFDALDKKPHPCNLHLKRNREIFPFILRKFKEKI